MPSVEERLSRLEGEMEMYRASEQTLGAYTFAGLVIVGALLWAIAPSLRQMQGTGWTALGAVGTWVAGAATIVYVVLTYRLLRNATRTAEAEVMQKLMIQYDELRPQIRALQDWYMETAESGADWRERFREEIGVDGMETPPVDQSRFFVSRLFVRTRKLAEAGYLSDSIVAKAFGGQAIEDVFLNMVDPLDEIRAGSGRGRADEKSYRKLLVKYPRPKEHVVSVSGE